MDVLAVIPATQPSSLRPMAGRPLAVCALEQARAARRVARTVLVTADAKLARRAGDAGADVVAPPAEPTPGAMLSAALEACARSDGFAPAVAVMLDPVFPLRTSETIDATVDHLWRCGADSLITVRPVSENLWAQAEGRPAMVLPVAPGERRFHEVGAILGVRVGVFEQTGELPAGRIVFYEISALEALRLSDESMWPDFEALGRSVAAARSRMLLKRIKLLVFDFDGVMTDNRVLVFEDGREAVLCNRGDGYGLDLLRATGLPTAVISKEVNPVVGARCRKLKMAYDQGIDDKIGVLARVVREHGVEMADVAYMGNDVNDLDCLRAAGVAIVPADAHPDVLGAADIVTVASGGFGAVREVCDLIIAARAGREGANRPFAAQPAML